MEDIVHAQTVLLKSDVEKLMKKTGASSVKDAIRIAIGQYLKGV